MLICYELSMPRVNTWNGRWSGEGKLYTRIRSYKKDKGEKILTNGPYSYKWEDGWVARIAVRKVTAKEARKIRARSDGFLGYEWMIESVEQTGKISAPSRR